MGDALFEDELDPAEAEAPAPEQQSLLGPWHGWGLADYRGNPVGPTLHIGKLPNRRAIALYILDGSRIEPLAFFPNEDRALRGMAVLDRLLKLAPYPYR